ncbi:MAG: GntR family transcriptional regulator [Pararhodobacter sp.]|nr:GntR family transcriptional regulator [Pararhodobacter sp.]
MPAPVSPVFLPAATDPAALSNERAMALAVVRHLREAVVTGKLKPGDRIVERQLSAELNISRTPVREGLKLLELDGLVSISRNRGAEVTAFTPDEALRLFDVIAALEGLAARRLAESAGADTMNRLEELHGQMVFHYNRSQIDLYFGINSAIHDLVVAACGNPELAETHGRLMLRARRGRYMAIMSPDRWRQSVAEHEALMAALRARDPDAAASAWAAHLRHTGETLARALAEDSADAP